MSHGKPRIVMLVGPGQSSRIMYHGLSQEFDVECVILEKRVSARIMLRRRIKRLGIVKTFGQLVFIFFNRILSKVSQSRVAHLLERYGLKDSPYPQDLVKEVESANGDDVVRLLKKRSPDAVVVNGTRILSKNVLSSIDAHFINTHMGITPKYRGVHGGYWALANKDKEHCGVTVHIVDEGIDTGSVLYQDTIQIEPADNFNTYPLHQIAKAIPLMKAALNDIAANRLRTKAGVGPSQLWHHPTLFAYIKNRIVGGIK